MKVGKKRQWNMLRVRRKGAWCCIILKSTDPIGFDLLASWHWRTSLVVDVASNTFEMEINLVCVDLRQPLEHNIENLVLSEA